ncbi:MAG: hypothetical protein A2231_06555 [Candidatus Firestonebacteria bacterium RIFOXYA2_FULL_40_8]|nr:MAG: hypothetical protein A2231_06555 [Candidatus Firestonebacteria bacterium RIFOXYA2_FULL_40_8]
MVNLKRSKSFIITFSVLLVLLGLSAPVLACGPWYSYPGEIDSLSLIHPYFLRTYNTPDKTFDTYEAAMKKEWESYFTGVLKLDANKSSRLTGTILNDKPPKVISGYKDTDDYIKFMGEVNLLLSNSTPRKGWVDGLVSFFSKSKKEKEEPVLDTEGYYKLAVAKASDKTINGFLKARYAYQALRLSIEKGDYKRVIADYDLLMAPLGINSFIKCKALSYKAFAVLSLGEKEEALKYYSEIALNCPELNYVTTRSVAHFDDTVYKNLMNSKAGDRIKTAAFQLRVTTTNYCPPELLNAILDINPALPNLESSIVKTVYFIEQDTLMHDNSNIVTKYEEGISGFFKKLFSSSKYKELINSCEKAGGTKNIQNPALWYMYGTYLALIDGDTTRAEVLYNKAEACKTTDKITAGQIHLTGTLLFVKKENKAFSPELEKRIFQDIVWSSNVKNNYDKAPEYNTGEGIYSWDEKLASDFNDNKLKRSFIILCSQKLLELKDIPRAALCMSKAMLKPYYDKSSKSLYAIDAEDDYLNNISLEPRCGNYLLDVISNDSDLNNFELLLDSNSGFKGLKNLVTLDKTPFTTYILTGININKNDVIYLRGIKEMRKDNYEKALYHFNRIPKSYFEKEGLFSVSSLVRLLNGSKLFPYKTAVFSKEIPFPLKQENWQKMNLLEFSKYMHSLQLELKKVKDPALKAGIHYTLGSIYDSLEISGFKIVLGLGDISVKDAFAQSKWVKNKFRNYYPERYEQYPFNIPEIKKEFELRSGEYFLDTDYRAKAIKHYQEVVKLNSNNELTAKSCFALETNESMRALNREYVNTEFYKYIVKECSTVKYYK